MRLHLVAGCRELLLPLPLAPELAAGLIGPRARVATAFWLARDAGLAYHDFLREGGDRRLEVFGLSLRENFGARFEPVVVLPELLEAPPEGAALVAGLWAHAAPARLALYAVGLAAAADPEGSWAGGLTAAEAEPRLAALAAAAVAAGVPPEALETRALGVLPEMPAFAALWRNAVAGRLAARVGPRLAESGLALDPGPAGAALGRLLAAWARAGVTPAFGLSARELEGIAERALPALLAVVGGPGGADA